MNYLPLLIFGYLIISNKKSNYKEILSSLTEEDICTILNYLGIDKIKSEAISRAFPTLIKGEFDLQKILQLGLPLFSEFFNRQNQTLSQTNDFENDNLLAISEIANEEIYSQLKSYFS